MSWRDRKHLLDMLLEARRVQRFTAGVERDTFVADEIRWYAVLHALTVLGEAAARVSREGREAHPDIPWDAIVGIRNRIVHEYFRVNVGIVWNTAVDDIPELIPLLEAAAPDVEET